MRALTEFINTHKLTLRKRISDYKAGGSSLITSMLQNRKRHQKLVIDDGEEAD